MSTFPRRVVRLLIRAILVLVFVAIPAGVAYLGFVGLPQPFTLQVARALSGPQYEVRIDRIRLNLLRGLVALGIEVTDRERNPLLGIDRLAVGLNHTELLRQKFRVESLELDRANLQIPSGETSISLKEVSARVLLPQGQLRIPRAEGIFEGIRISLEAAFLHPLKFDPSKLGGGTAGSSQDSAADLLDVLRTIVHEDHPPEIYLQVRGDLADLQSVSVERATIRIGKSRWREVVITELIAAGSYEEGVITVENFLLRGDGATLNAAGMFSDRSGEAEILVRGNFHPLPLLRSLGMEEQAGGWEMSEAPYVDLHASRKAGSEPGKGWRVLGSINMENFSFRTVPVDFFGADFAWQDGAFLTRDARVKSAAVDAVLDAMVRDGVATVRAGGSLNPVLCLPWLDAGMQRVVSEMELAEPALAEVELKIPLADSGALRGSGRLELGRTAMRGAWIEGGSADLVLANRAVEYRNIDLRMDGGKGTGDFVYDFGRKEVRLSNIRATVPPEKILLWVDRNIAKAVEPYRWRVPPATECEGTVDMAEPEKTTLTVKVNAPEGLEYELLGKVLSFSDVTGRVKVRGRELRADVDSARLFGGSVTLNATVSLDRNNPTYQLQTRLNGVDFASINKLYFGYTGSDGELSADFSYKAEFARQTQLVGSGSIRVENGNVFAIPVLGPLSVLFGSIIPGAGYQTARLATADFTIAEEVIRTNNLEIVGAGFSLFGEGDIRFMKDELDMTVRLNAQGAPGIVLMPVSKLFEYSGTGSLADPDWRPRNIPREVTGEGILDTVTNPVRQLLGGENGLLGQQNENEGEQPAPSGSPSRPRLKTR